ncbi:hypothetical protein GCM10028819_13640 [Spirosoma humi]
MKSSTKALAHVLATAVEAKLGESTEQSKKFRKTIEKSTKKLAKRLAKQVKKEKKKKHAEPTIDMDVVKAEEKAG